MTSTSPSPTPARAELEAAFLRALFARDARVYRRRAGMFAAAVSREPVRRLDNNQPIRPTISPLCEAYRVLR